MNRQAVPPQTKKSAIILFNLGGPNPQTSTEKFLFNLFYDKAIITLPNPFRWAIAKIISYFRAKSSQKNYDLIGGYSPIVDNTELQAQLLEQNLLKNKLAVKTFICMRYSYPQVTDIIHLIRDYRPDELILLPLYPQFSTTTSASSIEQFNKIAKKYLPNIVTKSICCFFGEPKFIESQIELILKATEELDEQQTVLIFSAHGLPQKIIDSGDPYQWQVEQTVAQILKQLPKNFKQNIIAYQSRVGPVEWLKPYTDKVIMDIAVQKLAIVIVPIAFVSEHLETLVELDIEYKELALHHGATAYIRVKTPSTEPSFITSLTEIVSSRINDKSVSEIASWQKNRVCTKQFGQCICQNNSNNDLNEGRE